MALKATVRRAVKAAFKALDDIPRKVTYKSTGAPQRNLDAGTATRPVTPYTLPMVAFVRFSAREVEKDPLLLLTDVKMLFPTEDLPVAAKENDIVTDDKGTTWEVIRRLSDPADVLTTLQTRTS